jgi:hypothetical protein
VTDLLTLATTYCQATGERLWPVSAMATGSEGTLYRIRRGHGCHSRTAERAGEWFDRNWPADLPWPEDVPRPSAYNRPGDTGEARAGGLTRSGAPGRDCGPC